MLAAAAWPLEMVRTARMILEACRLRKCREASRPSPVLLPVMMMVWPLKSVVGRGGVTRS